ncbi:MAG: hypothetical protein LUI87_12635 [Lachnospiraceae bacterium]|nr:hypothetical protein [Lachnospiraceae bacterium]
MNKDTVLQRIIKTVALPVVLYLIFAVISLVTGNSFLTMRMFIYMLKLSCVIICVAVAIGFHSSSSGFDFAIGAIVYLACIIGGNFAVQNKYGIGVLAVAVIAAAAVLSVLEGVMYVVLRLPPVVNSLVYLMICEALTQILNNGRGVSVLTKPTYTWFAREPQMFIITGIVLVVYWAILKFTKFGFNDRALSNGQKIAVSFGVKEIRNVLIRYLIVGVFLGVAGLFYLGQNYEVTAAQNMESTILMFSAVLPNMVAITLGKYSNRSIGVLMAVVSMEIISVGFVCMKMDSNLAQVISGVFVLAFVAYTMNQPRIAEHFRRKEKNRELQLEFRTGR